MDKRKRGIALFITLMVIASIMSIIAVSFTYLEKVQKDAGTTSAILQGNLLYKNTVDILNSQGFNKKQGNNEKLKILYSMPLPLVEPKSGFNLILNCKPLIVGLPIGWLDSKEVDKRSLANEVLVSVMEHYDVQEPQELRRLIMQAVTGKVSQNDDSRPRIRGRKGIISKGQFFRIVSDYCLLFDDSKVLSIPWERYFSFVKIDKKTKIDSYYPTAEFISVAFEIPIEIVKESWIFGESKLENFLSQNSIVNPYKKMFSSKALNAMHCEESYVYGDGQYKMSFDYIEGRSGNFEFNGKAE